jgi:hypothetical protein
LYYASVIRVHPISLPTKWAGSFFQLYSMFTNGRGNTFHISITPNEHVFLFMKKGFYLLQKFIQKLNYKSKFVKNTTIV